ncbi:hypothetical protein GCM10009665_44720 [Kitasatospora nipponensis]|uniref:Uncharacterized protein n=1 Tax=Kitasatospora nipponensis TaxID=258049 RepID=A0ABN1WHU9_9ACTN
MTAAALPRCPLRRTCTSPITPKTRPSGTTASNPHRRAQRANLLVPSGGPAYPGATASRSLVATGPCCCIMTTPGFVRTPVRPLRSATLADRGDGTDQRARRAVGRGVRGSVPVNPLGRAPGFHDGAADRWITR